MTINSTAQLYEVPLDQRIQQSATIVEGQVISSTSYLAADNNIYTAHKVRAFQLLKGNLQNPYFTVITYGGTAEGIQQTWTHLLTLQKDDIGVFFLIPTNRPLSEELLNGKTEIYEVYASSQGFLAYHEDDNRQMMATAPFNHHPKNVLLQSIKQVTGQSVHINTTGNPEDQTGVAYSFQNVTLSGNTLDFDIYVEGVWGSYDLVKSGILIEYDAAILGTNIAGSGVLNVTKGTASASSTYNLSVTDIANDEVEIEIDAPNTGLALHTITNLQEQLVHVQITAGAVGNPNIEFNESNMQQLSDFLNSNNATEAFQ